MVKLVERKTSDFATRGSATMFEDNCRPREITTDGILAGMARVRSLFSEEYEEMIKNSSLMVRDSDEHAG